MKQFTRIFACVLCLLMLVTLFAACGKKDTASDAESLPGLSTADVNYIVDGAAAFAIVKPDDASDAVNTCAMDVFKKYKATLEVTPKNITDDTEETGAEIIIGDCNRESTKVAKQLLLEKGNGRINEYIICTVGDDIVIYAYEDSSLKTAVEVFNETYLASATVTGGIYTVFAEAGDYDDYKILDIQNIRSMSVVRPIYNISYVVQLEINKLCKDLADKGGYSVDVKNDQIASKTGSVGGTLTRSEESEYEIVVGNCARDGVETIYDKNAYEIRVDGKKIYLNGGSPQATAMAVSEFYKALMSDKSFDSSEAVADGSFDAAIKNYDTAEKYTLTWGDDFEGSVIDESKWTIEWDMSAGYGDVEGAKKNYRGSSKLKNNYVKDGKLYMEAKETEDAYYGGMIHTKGMTQYRYGYAELSTLHPKGLGFWQSIYTMSAISPDDLNIVDVMMNDGPDNRMYYTEADFDECFGDGMTAQTHIHVHPTRKTKTLLGIPDDVVGNINPAFKYNSLDDRGFWQDFHTFGFEWNSNKKVTFYVDGVVSKEYDFTDPSFEYSNQFMDGFSQAVFFRLGLVVGSPIAPDKATDQEWAETNKYIVDYVHVYQLKGQQFYEKNGTKWKEFIKE
jgi:beta-glucanase (GH16 family)